MELVSPWLEGYIDHLVQIYIFYSIKFGFLNFYGWKFQLHLFVQIKDFWREAQILSTLHHPNVVAFYGVVPDGPGGTLATITEYMVNGSLRNVLIRKDRWVDSYLFHPFHPQNSFWILRILPAGCLIVERGLWLQWMQLLAWSIYIWKILSILI